MDPHDWIDLGNGRKVYRKIGPMCRGPRSDLPMPMLARDTIDPTRSMADGKLYTSKAAMRATYKSGGNPQGVEYTEVGDDASYTAPAPRKLPRADRKAIRETIERAKADLANG